MNFTPGDSTTDVINAIKALQNGVVTALNSINMTYINGNQYLDNGAVAVVIAATDTPVEIPGPFTPGFTNDVTITGGKGFTINTAGKYLCMASIAGVSAAVNEEAEICFMVNGVARPEGTTHAQVGIGAATRPECLAINTVLNLAAGSVISLAISNHSSTADFTIQHVNFTIIKIA